MHTSVENDTGNDLITQRLPQAFHGGKFLDGGVSAGCDVDEDDPAVDKLNYDTNSCTITSAKMSKLKRCCAPGLLRYQLLDNKLFQ